MQFESGSDANKSPRADLEVKMVSVTGGKALSDSREWSIPDLRVGWDVSV